MQNRIMGLLLGLCVIASGAAAQDGARVAAESVRARWEHANFELRGDAQRAALKALTEDCDGVARARDAGAALLTWCGISYSSYAGVKGGLGALGAAKEARRLLERAVSIERGAVNGAALCSLGTLYAKVPGWPLGFGSDDKAERYLTEALQVAPSDIDNNYFMADFLYAEQREPEARHYLERARHAAQRPGREIADRGRQAEIRSLLARINHQ
ncbi:hypothetical protein [Parahaliea mediterranea]|uniref:Tetratricopeptide repeat protein n=1 Tax=Parahaliea mediterranea TaxID=651086 RepID=A0A939DET5_9GAMM|nr:hypothetical protein [Parahaliea mediterranea]MBN7796749.1 hypothetical protein [Parahaliea mediterranea]